MQRKYPFGGDSPARNTRYSGEVPIELENVSFALPYVLIRGSRPGRRLVVTAGIHGGEYPCVEAAVRLGQTIAPDRLAGEVLMIPSANPTAFAARSIYVTPADGKNLNRAFPGSADGTFTDQWARWLFDNVIDSADAYIDLHGGDMIEALVPFTSCYATDDTSATETAQAMARAFGIRHVLMHPKRTAGGPGGMAVLTAAEAGIPSLLAEAGGQGVWDEDDVTMLHDGVIRVLADLGMYATVDADPLEEPVILSGWSWLRSDAAGLFYPSVTIGEHVEAGWPLGRVADFFGNTLQEITCPASGIVLFLVTSLAMNPGDPLMAIAY